MVRRGESSRREFLGGVGAIAALTGLGAAPVGATAQSPLTIVDFHNHYVDPSWALTTVGLAAPSDRPRWHAINSKLQSAATLLGSMAASGVSARVINTPTAFLEDADGNVPKDAHPRINDQVAALCATHTGTLHGLATVDAFAGLHPVTVGAAVDLLGADHVLMGTDWPVADERSIPERLAAAMAHAGLDAAQQRMVAGGNTLRLLGVA